MNAQVITTPNGERMIMLSEADYNALVEAAEDASDRAAVTQFRSRLAAGEEELVPEAMLDAILAGENKVRVWRKHRGMTMAALAKAAGVSQPFISQIEDGKREGKADTLRKIADALKVSLDDLVA